MGEGTPSVGSSKWGDLYAPGHPLDLPRTGSASLPRVLNQLRLEIAELLTVLVQLGTRNSLDTRGLEVVDVTPLFRKGSRRDPENYRAVTLTSVEGNR